MRNYTSLCICEALQGNSVILKGYVLVTSKRVFIIFFFTGSQTIGNIDQLSWKTIIEKV